MSEAPSFPWPWSLELDRAHGNHQLRAADGDSIAAFDEAEDGAAALRAGLLCAAAPDLFESVAELVDIYREGVVDDSEPECIRRALAALHKARSDA